MRLHHCAVAVVSVLAFLACGGEKRGLPARADEAAAAPEGATTEPVAAVALESSAGSVTFTVDGKSKRFGFLPPGGNVYVSLSSSIRALPAAGSPEHLSISFISIDLKSIDYPADLPVPKDFRKPMSPGEAMANVGYSYIDESGQEWAGPGRIHIRSFGKDGVVEATFTDVSLPHTRKERPNVVLSDGVVRARITSPW